MLKKINKGHKNFLPVPNLSTSICYITSIPINTAVNFGIMVFDNKI